jgi:hypothetical protein
MPVQLKNNLITFGITVATANEYRTTFNHTQSTALILTGKRRKKSEKFGKA